jgi:hypothetical protein
MSKLAHAGDISTASPALGTLSAPDRTASGMECGVEHRHADVAQCRSVIKRRIATDQDHRPRMACHRFHQRREVLSLALTTEDQAPALRSANPGRSTQRQWRPRSCPCCRQNTPRPGPSRWIRHDAVRPGTREDRTTSTRGCTLRLHGQRQRRQSVQGVVATPDAQGVRRHQPLDVATLRRHPCGGAAFRRPHGREPAKPCH